MSVSKKRQSNYEMLRIIAILMIIQFHYVYKAGWEISQAPLLNVVVIDAFWMFGEIGVNLFVLISGYFLICGKFSWKKLVALILQVVFYNYLSLFVVSGFSFAAFFEAIRIDDLFPTLFGRYWFATAYVLLYLFSPFLSRGLRALSRKEMMQLIVVMVVVWCVLPTLMSLANDKNNTESFLFYNRFVWMVVLFAIGGFVRLHGGEMKAFGLRSYVYAFAAIALFALLVVFMLLVELHPSFALKVGIRSATLFWPPNSVPQLFVSILIFMAFRQLRMPSVAAINRLASTTFGVYLLHDGYLQKTLWHDVFHNATHLESPELVLWIVGTSLVVFSVGALVDFIRQGVVWVINLVARKCMDDAFGE